jgi:uncharacterized coiled-coil protein SlyX
MTMFNLDFHGTRFTVPKPSLFYLFEHQRDLFDATSYEVQSLVPVGVFEVFVESLKTGTKVSVTKENARALSLLAKEFWLGDLVSECSALKIASVPEQIAALSERISNLEHQISCQQLTLIAELKESIANQVRQLESLSSGISSNSATHRTEIDEVKQSVQLLQTDLKTVKSKCECEALVARILGVERTVWETLSPVTRRLSVCEQCLEQMKASREIDALLRSIGKIERNVSLLGHEFERKISESLSPITGRLSTCETGLERLKSILSAPCPAPRPIPPVSPHAPIATLTPVTPVSQPKALQAVEFPLRVVNSLKGIIAHLTWKHGGNVHDKGIVAITSKSVYDDPEYAVRNLADLTFNPWFLSKNEPGQWVCWDFREMRIRPTHYTIGSAHLKSWVVESSLDFVNWTEIHRKTDDRDFNGHWMTKSFAVSKSVECRFVRLTQAGKTHERNDYLHIQAFEFFGTLLE